jgi:elongator complex protein 3
LRFPFGTRVPVPKPTRRRLDFDPQRHRRDLSAIFGEIAALPALSSALDSDLDPRELDRILKRHPKDGRGLFSRSELIAGVRALGTGDTDLDAASLVGRLRLRPVRTLSGVTPVTVLTRPFPCPGQCIFCPNDVRMPKSYLSAEPGAQRAEDNGFDPYLQTWNRLLAFHEIGHPVDKVELIVLGGTWSFHPEPYQVWFVRRCLEAMNEFAAGIDGRGEAGAVPSLGDALTRRADRAGPDTPYNTLVGAELNALFGAGLLHESERGSWDDLVATQRSNEEAGSRCVGLAVETRPDCVSADEVRRLRRLGVTKVQLGIQSLDDAVLEANRRGHDVETSRRAVGLLRAAGFKLHAHWMPNLLGSTAAKDARDFARLFEDPAIRPDELKIYPCFLIESAELAGPWRRGEWSPYPDDVLVELLAGCLEATPVWCRLTRVIRDFSAGDIAAGTHTANLREVAERRLADTGRACRDIRSREVRGAAVDPARLRLEELDYESAGGREHFLALETPEGGLAGFLRLSLPRDPAPIDEVQGRALIREVHVYGASLELGLRRAGPAQHRGLGRRLVEAACQRAWDAGYRGISVISSVGTRAWYRRLGFQDGELYQHRDLSASSAALR